jgi:hypothetical protein
MSERSPRNCLGTLSDWINSEFFIYFKFCGQRRLSRSKTMAFRWKWEILCPLFANYRLWSRERCCRYHTHFLHYEIYLLLGKLVTSPMGNFSFFLGIFNSVFYCIVYFSILLVRYLMGIVPKENFTFAWLPNVSKSNFLQKIPNVCFILESNFPTSLA